MLMAWRHETQAALDLPGQPLEFGGDEDPTNSTGERKKLGPFFSATVVLTSLHLPPTQDPGPTHSLSHISKNYFLKKISKKKQFFEMCESESEVLDWEVK